MSDREMVLSAVSDAVNRPPIPRGGLAFLLTARSLDDLESLCSDFRTEATARDFRTVEVFPESGLRKVQLFEGPSTWIKSGYCSPVELSAVRGSSSPGRLRVPRCIDSTKRSVVSRMVTHVTDTYYGDFESDVSNATTLSIAYHESGLFRPEFADWFFERASEFVGERARTTHVILPSGYVVANTSYLSHQMN